MEKRIMSEQNYSIERDLKEAQAMAEALVPYVYEDELYGRVGMNMPSLTVGAVLLRLHRLRELSNRLSPDQLSTLQNIEHQVQTVRHEWGNHFEKKLSREAEARLRDIMTYVKEAKEAPRNAANSYMPEALRRTIVQDILEAMSVSDRETIGTRVRQVDGDIRRYLQDADFIWSADLRPAYPIETYWWLYKRPHQPDAKTDAG
jgi:hypothetical protein